MVLRLRWADAEIVHAARGSDALEKLRADGADIVLLDLGLPDKDGKEVIVEMRRFSDAPIIVLTARAQEIEIVRSLESGADDYIVKPFSSTELLARIGAVLRRAQLLPGNEPPFVCPGLSMDFSSREILRHRKPVKLTPLEYSLLYHLVKNSGKVLSHKTLLAKVWGREYIEEIEYLKVHMQRLRAKLEDDPHNPTLIVTERGVGYRFVEPCPAQVPAQVPA